MRVGLVIAVVVAALGACTTSPLREDDPEESLTQGSNADPASTPACEEVRAGIGAFNAGDFEETVARFRAAVPLATEQLDGSEEADDLLEAVTWYAELPADDYAEAFASSPEFRRYQGITLGQCGDGTPPQESGGVEV